MKGAQTYGLVLTLKVGNLSSLPPLRHAIQLRSLPEDGVRDLGSERCSSKVERPEGDGGRTPRSDHLVRLGTLVLGEGNEEASSVGKEEFEGDVAEEVLALVDFEEVAPCPSSTVVSRAEVDGSLLRVATCQIGEGREVLVSFLHNECLAGINDDTDAGLTSAGASQALTRSPFAFWKKLSTR